LEVTVSVRTIAKRLIAGRAATAKCDGRFVAIEGKKISFVILQSKLTLHNKRPIFSAANIYSAHLKILNGQYCQQPNAERNVPHQRSNQQATQ